MIEQFAEKDNAFQDTKCTVRNQFLNLFLVYTHTHTLLLLLLVTISSGPVCVDSLAQAADDYLYLLPSEVLRLWWDRHHNVRFKWSKPMYAWVCVCTPIVAWNTFLLIAFPLLRNPCVWWFVQWHKWIKFSVCSCSSSWWKCK